LGALAPIRSDIDSSSKPTDITSIAKPDEASDPERMFGGASVRHERIVISAFRRRP